MWWRLMKTLSAPPPSENETRDPRQWISEISEER
jgi:hypothetical protein